MEGKEKKQATEKGKVRKIVRYKEGKSKKKCKETKSKSQKGRREQKA